MALDRQTREIVGLAIGPRDQATAQALWDCLSAVYCQCIVCYIDFWAAYQAVLPRKRHRAVDKASGQTKHIERLNNTLRQRIGHLGAIWLFLHPTMPQRNEAKFDPATLMGLPTGYNKLG